MSETPRKRLAKLMDDLELPKGFRLTPIRESLLRKLGKGMLLGGPLTCYRGKVRYSNLVQRWKLDLNRAEKAALRGAALAGWMTAQVNVTDAASYWREHKVVFQPGIEALAKRLGARDLLWDKRKLEHTDKVRTVWERAKQDLWEMRRTLSAILDGAALPTDSVAAKYERLRVLTAQATQREAELMAAREEVALIPEPSEDDALTWLMMEELKRANAPSKA